MTSIVRADHVGSLLRPPDLLQAREANSTGALSDDELREREDAAILAALGRQRDVGLEVFTDGEFRRGSWITDMAELSCCLISRQRLRSGPIEALAR